jgi:hypothetical protein
MEECSMWEKTQPPSQKDLQAKQLMRKPRSSPSFRQKQSGKGENGMHRPLYLTGLRPSRISWAL